MDRIADVEGITDEVVEEEMDRIADAEGITGKVEEDFTSTISIPDGSLQSKSLHKTSPFMSTSPHKSHAMDPTIGMGKISEPTRIPGRQLLPVGDCRDKWTTTEKRTYCLLRNLFPVGFYEKFVIHEKSE